MNEYRAISYEFIVVIARSLRHIFGLELYPPSAYERELYYDEYKRAEDFWL